MDKFWDETIFLLETLVMKAYGQDDDGMELTFTNGPVTFHRTDSASEVKRLMERSSLKPAKNVRTNMRASLNKILNEYLEQIQRHQKADKGKNKKKELKKLTILVLTDGIWSANPRDNDVEDMIVNFAGKLEEQYKDYGTTRQVSIEFVQLGYDEAAAFRMRCLDDELESRGVA